MRPLNYYAPISFFNAFELVKIFQIKVSLLKYAKNLMKVLFIKNCRIYSEQLNSTPSRLERLEYGMWEYEKNLADLG